MQSLNFELLRTYASDLAEHGAFAEHYAYTDPASAVVKLRIVAEQLVLHICDCLSLQLPPRPKLCDLLEDPSFQRVAPKAIRYKIDAVRIHGNHGAHGQTVSIDTALCMLRETYRIVCWIFLVYVREVQADCPSYREPAPPPGVEWPPTFEPSIDVCAAPCPAPDYLESSSADQVTSEDLESGSDAMEFDSDRPREEQKSGAPEERRVRFSLGVAPEAHREVSQEPSRRFEAFGAAAPKAEEEPSVDLAAMKKRTTLRQRLGKQGMLTAGIRGSLAARRATRA